MDERSEVVRWALGYPHATPPRSFVLVGGRALDLDRVEVEGSGRLPLLAYGSNASPAVLARKLAPTPDPVPVVRAALSGFDVVYSAHISPYGSVPATLQRSPGTEARVFVAYLSEAQLRRVSETEPNYELTTLPRASCRHDDGESPSEPAVYLSRHGCLLLDGSEAALAAVEARRRALPEMTEPEVLERVRQLLCPERTLEQFVAAAASRPELARRWTERLRKASRALV